MFAPRFSFNNNPTLLLLKLRIKRYLNYARAQCYPRHACPLYVSLFMHVHVLPLSAPALALQTHSDPIWIMRIHASICILMQKQKAT